MFLAPLKSPPSWMRRLQGPFSGLALIAAVTVIASPDSFAETDTEQARRVYAHVNAGLDGMQRLAFTTQVPGAEFRSRVLAWRDAQGIRKLLVTDADDDGEVTGEYFFEHGELLFYFGTIKGYTESGRLVTRIETRQYFTRGRMTRWLAGIGTDRGTTPSGTPEFSDEERQRLAAASHFLSQANRQIAGKSRR